MINILTQKIEDSLIESEDIELVKTIDDKFPYPLDNFQKHACFRTSKNENVLVTANTGSGKTLIAEHAILESIRLGKKAIYTSPIKSLSNQKFSEFTKKFGDKMSIGILTGDIKFNPDADCIIMTTEILRNLLYKKNTLNKIFEKTLTIDIDINNDVHAVIFDEVHYINDKDRGKVWEECIILLPQKINLVMLSATIDKADEFAQWVQDVKEKPMNLIPTTHRVVPLRHYIYTLAKMPKNEKDKKGKQYKKLYLDRIRKYSNKMKMIVDDKGKFFHQDYDETINLINDCYKNYNRTSEVFLLNTLVEYLEKTNRLPCLFFVFSRKNCKKYSEYIQKSLNDTKEQAEVQNIINKQLHRLEEPAIYINSPQLLEMKSLLMKGIAIHHSGLIPVLKEIIEILFSKGLIKVLFATETFAVGVNMPTKTVVFTNLFKYSSDCGLRMMYTHEYLQMSGRAGRRGLDKVGNVILLPNMWRNDIPTSATVKSMMTGKSQVITSQFDLNYQFLLKVMLTENSKLSVFIERTLMNREIMDRKRILVQELEKCRKIFSNIPESKYSNEEFDEYYYLLHPNENLNFGSNIAVTIKTKKNKKSKNILKKFKSQPNFIDEYNNYLKVYDDRINLAKLEYELNYHNTIINTDLIKVLKFLQNNDYINYGDITSDMNPDNIKKEHITKKGIMGSQINECNEILFPEIIINDVFKELNVLEIIGILSMFLETKPLDEEKLVYDHYNLNISTKMKESIDKMFSISEYLSQMEQEFEIQLETNWNLNLNMIMPSMMWASGKLFTETHYDNFEGNFIKDMIKIGNISKDLEVMGEFLGKLELMAKCSKIDSLIIRDMVTIDSLYIKN